MTGSDLPYAPILEPEELSDGSRRDWIIGLIAILLLFIGPIVIFIGVRHSVQAANTDDPWASVPTRSRIRTTRCS